MMLIQYTQTIVLRVPVRRIRQLRYRRQVVDPEELWDRVFNASGPGIVV